MGAGGGGLQPDGRGGIEGDRTGSGISREKFGVDKGARVWDARLSFVTERRKGRRPLISVLKGAGWRNGGAHGTAKTFEVF